jgi:RND family efflux transporter MFP subunit
VDLIAAQTTHDAAVSALTSAAAKLDQARVQTQTNLTSAQADVDAANAGVTAARVKLEATLLGPASADRVAAQTAVDSAQATFDAAQSKLDALNHPLPQDLNSARAAAQGADAGLRSAQAKLDQLRGGPQAGDLESAKSAVTAALAGLADKSGTGVRQSDLAIQEAAVRQAQVGVRQAKRDLDAATLVAPFDGVVASVGCAVGEQLPCAPASASATSGSSAFMVLVDLSRLQVQATIGQADVARVRPGQLARVTFDAFSGQTFRGTVASLSTQGTSNQGAVTYGVTLDLDTAGTAIPPGLTANVTVVVDHKGSALAVPPEVLRRENKSVVLDVLGPDGSITPRAVTIGIERDSAVELTSGVDEGEQVVLPTGASVSALASLTD